MMGEHGHFHGTVDPSWVTAGKGIRAVQWRIPSSGC
jgi:hypothetical protein